MRIILASSSQRRKMLMDLLGIKYEVIPPRVKEESGKEDYGDLVMDLAMKKAWDVFDRTFDERVVIAADTIVVLNGMVLGKPRDPSEAREYLKLLSGKEHVVYTGVAFVWNDGEYSFYDRTKVKFRKLPDALIDRYVASGAPLDKAGAYGIQDLGAVFVEKIEGDFYTVMGLPIGKVWEYMYRKGWWK